MKKQDTPKQKPQLVLEIFKEEKTVAQIASEYSGQPPQLYKWKNQALEGLPMVFEDQQKAQRDVQAAHDQQVQERYTEIGKLNTQLTWLKKNLVSNCSRSERLAWLEPGSAELALRQQAHLRGLSRAERPTSIQQALPPKK